ncbi:hypothetical protein BJ508DRAFT_304962 [Ascobolus immersus RN42]|uniref:Uncharacterized protein n=1 Tax=Ascobolus immersus RN42 TaxID=1160509 RepID=A0A3N4IEV8_ASCIM|nr:hypothetical protein BJ508DRAFT_304962 [Ascobolus immersus RN42]
MVRYANYALATSPNRLVHQAMWQAVQNAGSTQPFVDTTWFQQYWCALDKYDLQPDTILSPSIANHQMIAMEQAAKDSVTASFRKAFNKPLTYLNFPRPFATAVARLRSRTHQLAIETGGWTQTPVELRLCATCGTTEDERHALLHCTDFYQLRERLNHNLQIQPPSASAMLARCANPSGPDGIHYAQFRYQLWKTLRERSQHPSSPTSSSLSDAEDDMGTAPWQRALHMAFWSG